MTGRTGVLREAPAGSGTGRRFSSFFDRPALQRDSGPKALHSPILSVEEYRLGPERLPEYLRGPDGYGIDRADGIVAERLGPRVGFFRRVGATVEQAWYDVTAARRDSVLPLERFTENAAAGVERYRAGVARVSRSAGRLVRQLVAEQRTYLGDVPTRSTSRQNALAFLGSGASLDKQALIADPVLPIWSVAAVLDTVRIDWAADIGVNDICAALGRSHHEFSNAQHLYVAYRRLYGSGYLRDVSASTIAPRLDTAEAWYEMGRLLRMSADLAYLGDTQGFQATTIDRASLALRAFETAQSKLHDEIGAKTPATRLRFMDGSVDPGPIEYLGYLVSRYSAARRDTAAVVAYLGSRSP